MNTGRTHPVPYLAFARTAACLPRFLVSVQRPDGHADTWHRIGGSSTDHALEAQELGGIGSVVRVVPVGLTEAA